jgi:hypothetical protein
MAEGIYLLMGRVSSSHLCLYVTMASRRAVKTISHLLLNPSTLS